jgi:outer membrane biosynthesis protein TonB
MLPIFHSTPFAMRNEQPDQQRGWTWCLLAAIVMHVLVAALVLPRSLGSPLKEEQAITVELVKDPNPPEKAKTEAPPPANPPKPEKAPEASAPIPPPTNASSTPQGRPPKLMHVPQFGDKDRGPRKSPDGNSTENGAASPVAPPDPAKQSLPQILAATTATGTDEVPLGTSTKAPTPEDAAQAQQGSKLTEAKRLFSPDATSDLSTMIAIGSMPRGDRAAQLCGTELKEQLRHATPAHIPYQYPFDRLQEGTVIDAPNSAFEENSLWYDLSYRCELNAEVTKVVAFAFRVGGPLPRSEWASRGIPPE